MISTPASTPLHPVVILAGGLATRMKPLTEKIPKAMLEVAGEPFVAHQLRLWKRSGGERVVICAGHLGEMIREYVGDGSKFELHVEYSFDGPVLMGTAGAIRRALPMLGDRFFTLYGDSYLTCDYRLAQNAFDRSGALALMSVYRNQGRFDRSNVEFADGALRVYDKKNATPAMQHIDYGLGLFQRAAFDEVPADQPFDLAILYQRMLSRGLLMGWEVNERFYEIGSPEGLAELRHLLAKKPT